MQNEVENLTLNPDQPISTHRILTEKQGLLLALVGILLTVGAVLLPLSPLFKLIVGIAGGVVMLKGFVAYATWRGWV